MQVPQVFLHFTLLTAVILHLSWLFHLAHLPEYFASSHTAELGALVGAVVGALVAPQYPQVVAHFSAANFRLHLALLLIREHLFAGCISAQEPVVVEEEVEPTVGAEVGNGRKGPSSPIAQTPALHSIGAGGKQPHMGLPRSHFCSV